MPPLDPPPTVDVGLYVHVAFCKTKCYYCDFNAYAGLGNVVEPYVKALTSEIGRLPQLIPAHRSEGFVAPALANLENAPGDAEPTQPFRIGSIFFGGGTPSLLATKQIDDIFAAAHRWPVTADAEVSLEANPDDPTVEYLRSIRELGVNRLSFGVQSFDDALLHRLGRRHNARAAVLAYEQARAAGFANVSLDLMFALPGQSLKQWQATVDRAIALAPDHLSLYCLTIEPDTPFGAWSAAGKLVVPDDDSAADMYEAAMDRLGAAGYVHYEISNWARADDARDWRAQHNLRYWRNQPYFGVGAGAHSSSGGLRYANELSPARYIAAIGRGESAVQTSEVIDRPTEMAETMMLGLRLTEGVSAAAFRARFGCSPDHIYGSILRELRDYNLLEPGPDPIRLTRRGRLLGNEVFCRFLA